MDRAEPAAKIVIEACCKSREIALQGLLAMSASNRRRRRLVVFTNELRDTSAQSRSTPRERQPTS
jgi:hypothetical protein